MSKLKIKRFIQEPGHCAISSSATVGNYYDKSIDYEKAKIISQKKIERDTSLGLETGEIGSLLNYLGFNKVTIISSNLFYLDYSWARLSKKNLITNLEIARNKVSVDYSNSCNTVYKFLKLCDYDNNLIIDFKFGDYIKETLDKKNPLILTFNWNMFFRYPKYNDKNLEDAIKGDVEEHAVVAYGYNKKGVNVCDSHHQYYKYKLKKHRKGFYTISWENLMSIMGYGDLIIPECFNN